MKIAYAGFFSYLLKNRMSGNRTTEICRSQGPGVNIFEIMQLLLRTKSRIGQGPPVYHPCYKTGRSLAQGNPAFITGNRFALSIAILSLPCGL